MVTDAVHIRVVLRAYASRRQVDMYRVIIAVYQIHDVERPVEVRPFYLRSADGIPAEERPPGLGHVYKRPTK